MVSKKKKKGLYIALQFWMPAEKRSGLALKISV